MKKLACHKVMELPAASNNWLCSPQWKTIHGQTLNKSWIDRSTAQLSDPILKMFFTGIKTQYFCLTMCWSMQCSGFILDVIFRGNMLISSSLITLLPFFVGSGIFRRVPRKASRSQKRCRFRAVGLYGRPGKAWEPWVQQGERDDDSGSGRKNLWDPSDQSDGRWGGHRDTAWKSQWGRRGGAVTDLGGTGFQALYREVTCSSSL